MKKLIMTAAVVACAASIVSAQTVTSQNIVGYTKFTAVEGEFTMVGLNFEPASPYITDLIGNQLPLNSKIFKWDKATDGYVSYTKSGRAAPGAWPGTATLELGDAFWVEVPVGGGSHEVILPGEVNLAATTEVTIATPTPYEMVSLSYPVTIAFGDTDLSAQLGLNSKIYLWTGSGYVSYTKSGRAAPGVWSAEAQAVVIGPSTSFWIESGAGTVNWSETRPFNP